MANKTLSDVEKIPVTNKVLRGSTNCGNSKSSMADRTAYKKYASESRDKLVGSVNRKAAESDRKDLK